MRAVASVVMNRVLADYGEYGRLSNTVTDAIYQSGQFDCARTTLNGQYNYQNIYNMAPEQIHYDVAAWALSGGRLPSLAYALWYFNPYSTICPDYFPNQNGVFVIRVGDHCFYNPTSLYANT